MVRARQCGAAGAISSQGSRQWGRGTDERRGACVGRRRRASRLSVHRSAVVLGEVAGAAWRWRDSAGASPEPPLPRALAERAQTELPRPLPR